MMYGPAQPLPVGMQLAQQGHLDVVPLGPLFDNQIEDQCISEDS